MSYSNEDIVGIKDDAIKSIKLAISELEGVDEYTDEMNGLESIISDLESKSEKYEERYEEEQRQEREYANSEYMRSVI